MKLTRAYLGLLCLTGIVVLGVQCGGGSTKVASLQCLHNSDCKSPGLQCSQGYCVKNCQASSDCPSGQRCIDVTPVASIDDADAAATTDISVDPSDAGLTSYTVCQAPEKKTCAYNSDCTPLTCGVDLQCRNKCKEDIDCPTGQKCTSVSKLCVDPTLDKKTYDPTTNELIPPDAGTTTGTGGVSGVGGKGGAESGTGGGAGKTGSGGAGGKSGTACTGPQTAFGNIAQGDTNPNFTSGVGVRTADRLLIFSSYAGPPVEIPGAAGSSGGGGGGAGGVGGSTVVDNVIFVQAFNPATGASLGAAAPLFRAASGTNFAVAAASIASTGEILLLHGSGPVNGYWNNLYASFLAAPATAGAAPQLKRTVQVESVNLGSLGAFWSSTNQQFVLYWRYLTTNWFNRIKKFQANGTPAGGDSNAVASLTNQNDPSYSSGVSGSGKLFAAAYRDYQTGRPYMTVLDADGNETASGFTPVSMVAADHWVQVGGTTSGFVALFQHGNTATGIFVPKTSDGLDVRAMPGAGGAGGDGGGAGGAGGATAAWPTFSIPSTATSSNGAYMISDEDGAGGVGTVLLEQNGASFLYVTADGTKRFAVGTVISSAVGTLANIANFHGSFAVSLHEATKHATQLVASECSP